MVKKKVLWKRLTTEMPQKLVLRNFRFILGNSSKLEKGKGFPNIFEEFLKIRKRLKNFAERPKKKGETP